VTLRVVRLDDGFRPDYEQFVQSLNTLTVYSTWEYRSFLLDLMGCSGDYLGAVDDKGSLLGVWPLMERTGKFGRVINSLPFFGSYGGPLGVNSAAIEALTIEFNSTVARSDVAAATVVENPFDPMQVSVPHDFLDGRIGQFTSLDLGEDAKETLFSRIDPTARRNLRKAEKSDVEVEIDNGAMRELEDIHKENMDAIGGRRKSEAFFELLPRHLPAGRMYNLYVARHGKRAIAALLVLYAGKVAEYFIPATRLDERARQPSALLLFHAMIDAHRRGFLIWNWGGTWMSQEGVLQFKRKWGAQDRPYRYFVKLNNKDVLSAGRDELLSEYDNFYVVPFDKLNSA
jgi:hypothetical protein